MKSRYRIAIILRNGFFAYQRELTRGIGNFVRLHRDWTITSFLETHPQAADNVNADGVIVFHRLAALDKARIPQVCVGTYDPPYTGATIQSDNVRMGELGADHLFACGLRYFAFVGAEPDTGPSPLTHQRLQGFRDGVERRGGDFLGTYHLTLAEPYDDIPPHAGVRHWVNSLPRPVGLMCVGDAAGRYMADVCQAANLRVPEDVAILGANNDQLMCTLANPPLSSVDPGAAALGYRAAAMLERLLAGEPVPAEPHLVPPLGVEQRASTDMLASDDPQLNRAVRFIRDHYTRPINAEDVVRTVSLSRAALFRRFRAELGESILQRITRLRIQHARQLLRETELPVAQIAKRSGFTGREYFSAAFSREMGTSPNGYRRRYRANQPG